MQLIPQTQPPALLSVWFQEASLAGSPTATIEPPQFGIDAFDNSLNQKSETWLRENKMLPVPGHFSREEVQIGGMRGVRLTTMVLMTPNVFYYVARGKSKIKSDIIA